MWKNFVFQTVFSSINTLDFFDKKRIGSSISFIASARVNDSVFLAKHVDLNCSDVILFVYECCLAGCQA